MFKISLWILALMLSSVSWASSPAGLDGVTIEAVEAYPKQVKSELLLGAGVYPFNPYYSVFTLDVSYEYRLNRRVIWEIVNASYMLSSGTDLLSQLAVNSGLTPHNLSKPNFSLSSNFEFPVLFGKFVSLDDEIRFFTAGLLLGAGVISASETTFGQNQDSGSTQTTFSPTLNFGFRGHVSVNSSFSCILSIIDQFAITNGSQNYLILHFGGGFSF